MDKNLDMDNIEQRVLLLGLYKKQDGETFNDILGVMEESRVFDLKTGKKYLKNLQKLNFINNNTLTMLGVQKAIEIEQEFKI